MEWKPQHPAIGRAAELLAALSLASAVAFAIFHAAPLGGSALVGAMAIAAGAAGFGVVVLLGRISETSELEREGFAPADFADCIIEEDDELLLNVPVLRLEPQSRVAELFEPLQPDALAEPGELVARIADYLGSGRGTAQPSAAAHHDATASLHAALADIRRSLG